MKGATKGDVDKDECLDEVHACVLEGGQHYRKSNGEAINKASVREILLWMGDKGERQVASEPLKIDSKAQT